MRMAALTHGRPKELLPLRGEPLLVHVLRECAASGADECLIVSAPGKDEIAHVAASVQGTEQMPSRIVVVEQSEPRGLADAIRLGRNFADGEPVGVALPDNIFVSRVPALAQVAAAYESAGKSAVAIIEISATESQSSGATPAYVGTRNGDLFHIAAIPGKGAHSATFDTSGASAAVTGVGRYVFDDEVFSYIDAAERGLAAGVELDDIPVLQCLLADGRLIGRMIEGHFFDVGLPSGYAQAVEALG